MRQGSETLSPKQGGGHTQREWWRRKISLRSFDRHIARRLHSPLVVHRRWNQIGYLTVGVGFRLSTQALHGYCPAQVTPFAEVIDLYLIVRLRSCVFQDYLLLSSAYNYAAPPLLYMKGIKFNTAVLVYDK